MTERMDYLTVVHFKMRDDGMVTVYLSGDATPMTEAAAFEYFAECLRKRDRFNKQYPHIHLTVDLVRE